MKSFLRGGKGARARVETPFPGRTHAAARPGRTLSTSAHRLASPGSRKRARCPLDRCTHKCGGR